MRFRLTYAGELLGAHSGNTRAKHKQAIRMALHPQLKRLWDLSPFLSENQHDIRLNPEDKHLTTVSLRDWLARNFEVGGIGFIPLITKNWGLHCSLHILFLRPGRTGAIIQGGDLDNRLKTLFDAFRRPLDRQELGGATPETTGGQVYCLLEDDKFIDNVSIETGELLEPIEGGFGANYVRLVVTVDVLPYEATLGNLDFIGYPS